MSTGHVHIVGTGLIGASMGLALKQRGWTVSGTDSDAAAQADALALGAIDSEGWPKDADVVIVATPAADVVAAVAEALDRTSGTVTDVGSVKADIVNAIVSSRFVGGHPMAGSEQEGVAGARPDLFSGATWVLTPGEETDDESFAVVHALVASLGAEVLTLEAAQHDRLVAMVSHVPHLTAATLMTLANNRSVEHRALLRLAAGGFRDMTRIASGRPSIWPDICNANAAAITEILDEFTAALGELRTAVANRDTDSLLEVLEEARRTRVNLPTTAPTDADLSVIRVPLLDRPGELARVTRLATDIDVNIYDIEIAHSVEGQGGVLLVIVETDRAERLLGALMANEYRPSVRSLPK